MKNRKIQVHSFSSVAGFSLIEVLVVLAILGMVSVAVGTFQKDIVSFNRTVFFSLQSVQDGRRALDSMTTELRAMQVSNFGSYPIAEASSSAITFFSDVNTDGYREQIRYYLSTSSPAVLMKQVIKPSGNPLTYATSSAIVSQSVIDIINGTTTPVFSYYDSSYDGVSSPLVSPVDISKVRLVKVTLIIEHDPAKAPIPLVYTTQVSLRNLKDNL